jgi:hypothetical protein
VTNPQADDRSPTSIARDQCHQFVASGEYIALFVEAVEAKEKRLAEGDE